MTECGHEYSLEERTVCAWCGEKHPMRVEIEKAERHIKRLEEDNRELFQEVMTGINDTARLAKENLDLKSRDSVRGYEKLGAENLALLERVRELEVALFASNEEIDDLKCELHDAYTRSPEQCIADECE